MNARAEKHAPRITPQRPTPITLLALSSLAARIPPQPKNEFEEVWDAYGRMVEPFVQEVPFMIAVGNHEHTPGLLTNVSGTYQVGYAAYQCRYAAVPDNGNSNLWFSFNHGAAHFVHINSEEDQSPASPQAKWLAADLAAAATNRALVPWIILVQHRPVYSSTKSEASSHLPGSGFAAVLEPYLQQYKVDLFLTGHQHQCE